MTTEAKQHRCWRCQDTGWITAFARSLCPICRRKNKKLPEEILEEWHAADLGVAPSLAPLCGHCMGEGYVVYGPNDAESTCPECLGIGRYEGTLVPEEKP